MSDLWAEFTDPDSVDLPDEPSWRVLHRRWWTERREPQPGDVEAAWAALWRVIPADDWRVSKPEYEAHGRTWSCSAQRLRRSAKGAVDVVSASGPTLPTVLVELARCFVEVEAGRTPR